MSIIKEGNNSRMNYISTHPEAFEMWEKELEGLGIKSCSVETSNNVPICKASPSLLITNAGQSPYSTIQIAGMNFSICSYCSISADKEETQIPVEINGIQIGQYFVDRNIIWLWVNPFMVDFTRKEQVKMVLEKTVEALKKCAIKTVSNKKIRKKILIKSFMKAMEKEIFDARNNRDRAMTDIRRYQDAMDTSVQRLVIFNETVKIIEEFKGNLDKRLFEQIELLKELPFIKKYSITTEGVKIWFKRIKINYAGKEYDLGEFSGLITPQGVKWEGTNPRGSFQHPHINGGYACFGTYQNEVSRLKSTCSFQDLVILLNAFLNTYNDKSPFCHIESWGVTEEQFLKRQAGGGAGGGEPDDDEQPDDEQDEEYDDEQPEDEQEDEPSEEENSFISMIEEARRAADNENRT